MRSFACNSVHSPTGFNMHVFELNMDGLVGPSHHYAGLATGNLASTTNALSIANPAAAARQGLDKMRLLHQLGIKQAIIPPHQRPNLHLLHELGFRGTPAQQVQQAKRAAPALLSACYSASSMWAANAATVSSSLDTQDRRVHFTAANLVSNLHRHQEADFSRRLLQHLFANEHYFQHHPVLPKTIITGDEGAANHSRLCANHASSGINLFVYGKQTMSSNKNTPAPKLFPARQTLEASQAITRSHRLNPEHVVFACQNPAAIDQGVFHNDVIAVANDHLLLIHEDAFVHQSDVLAELRAKATFPLQIIEVSHTQLSVADAVSSYVFNSQLITLPDNTMSLIAPAECEQNPRTHAFLHELLLSNTNPITKIHYLDLKQSMRNGGGPACLRLRVPLNENELSAMHQGILVNDALLDTLETWVMKHYRSELHANDLDDPALIHECLTALDELTTLLDLGSIYPFQNVTP